MNNKACFTWENIAYQSRLLALDQKGLDLAHNIGFDYWFMKKRIFVGPKGV